MSRARSVGTRTFQGHSSQKVRLSHMRVMTSAPANSAQDNATFGKQQGTTSTTPVGAVGFGGKFSR